MCYPVAEAAHCPMVRTNIMIYPAVSLNCRLSDGPEVSDVNHYTSKTQGRKDVPTPTP